MQNKLELYVQAKEAYYNGQPIMTDYEFDELERSLGLENKSYIGSKHNPSYTIQHPYIMGSLSKVQIHEDEKGNVDWLNNAIEVKKYVMRNPETKTIIATPKFDGCSFEALIKDNKIVSISTRGDGDWGKDIYSHLVRKFDNTHTNIAYNEYTLRGEVLINKKVFEEKYSEFVNPRSFVSGLLNRDYTQDIDTMLDDLSIVIYDIRYNKDGVWNDVDWTVFPEMHNTPDYSLIVDQINEDNLELLYKYFDTYRSNCEFALDGFVLKPGMSTRINNTTDQRPKDCVAIKFLPMLQETEIVDIEWKTGKTNELHPTIIVKPVIMDGKKITRASAHNYGYVFENKISIGTKVILSLAGDIIPFIYKITNTDNYDANKLNLPAYETRVDGCHLYKILSVDEWREMKFIQSAEALSIPNIGPAAAKVIFEYMLEQSKSDDFLGISGRPMVENILCCTPADISNALGGKSGANAMKSFEKFKKDLTLSDVIVSCTFESCGRKIADAIQDYLLFGKENFEHMATKAYDWALSINSLESIELYNVLEQCGKTLDIFKQEQQYKNETKQEQIPVIMTGEPNNYLTKGDFLLKNPQYRQTTSWKEVKIVFTNDLESKTGKMKKAIEKGIEIRLY